MHDATDIRAQLEEERRIIEAATGNLTRKSSGELHTVVSGNGMIRAKVGYGLEGGGAYVDAERLAHSWNALPVRNAQIEAVLALHKPHWDNLPWWRRQPNVPGCTECYDEGSPFQYPCATVKAIQGAGK